MGDTQRSKDYHEVPLDVATSNLSSIIQKGQFVVTLHGSAFQQVYVLFKSGKSVIPFPFRNNHTTSPNPSLHKGANCDHFAWFSISTGVCVLFTPGKWVIPFPLRNSPNEQPPSTSTPHTPSISFYK